MSSCTRCGRSSSGSRAASSRSTKGLSRPSRRYDDPGVRAAVVAQPRPLSSRAAQRAAVAPQLAACSNAPRAAPRARTQFCVKLQKRFLEHPVTEMKLDKVRRLRGRPGAQGRGSRFRNTAARPLLPVITAAGTRWAGMAAKISTAVDVQKTSCSSTLVDRQPPALGPVHVRSTARTLLNRARPRIRRARAPAPAPSPTSRRLWRRSSWRRGSWWWCCSRCTIC